MNIFGGLNGVFFLMKLNVLVILMGFLLQSMAQTLTYKNENFMEVYTYELISPNKYIMRDTAYGYSTPHTLDENKNLRVIFGITALDFHQSSASLSFHFLGVSTKRENPNPPKFLDFSLFILNQTVIYRMRAYVAVIQQDQIPEIYIRRDTRICNVMNKGIGYRSENYTFPVSVKTQFDPEVRQIYAALYYRGFNLFNPNGSYFYLNWEFYYNHTHYTIVFHTQDQNLISFIDFSIVLVDLNNAYQKNFNKRAFTVEMTNCSFSLDENCPGKVSQWVADPYYQTNFKSYLFGLSKLNFTKHSKTNWFFDPKDISNLVPNYLETKSLVWANMSVLIIAQIDCQPSSKAYDPYIRNCVDDCSTTGSPYFNTQSGGGLKTCRKCHYACVPDKCNNQQEDQCKACNYTKFRKPDSFGSTFKCQCMVGYIDVGIQLCRPCSYYIPGCLLCSSTTVCTKCNTDMYITSDKKCECTMNQVKSRDGQCFGIIGCLVYFNDPIVNTGCIECNITQNFILVNHSCQCIAGYFMETISGKWVCTPQPYVCGDGIRTINQQCDDFNIFNGDGCNVTCRVQVGFICFGNLRETSFCIENVSRLDYIGAMKVEEQQSVDLFFELWPYNGRLQDVGLLTRYLQTSIANFWSMKNLQIFTEHYFPNNKLRIRLRFDQTQDINPKIQHNLTLNFFDREKQLKLMTNFSIVGSNLKLEMKDSQDNLVPLNYCLLALIILGFLALFISLFTINWVGVQLIHTYQFCFFYCMMLQDIQQTQYRFLTFLEFSNGFNRIQHLFSWYEYNDYNKKIYLMGLSKQFITNFNFTGLLISLPLLLVIWKGLRYVFRFCQKKQILKESMQRSQVSPKPSALDVILSPQFIVGKVFITMNLAFMNIILISFFIQQTHHLQEDQILNGVFETIYIFVLLGCVMVTLAVLLINSWKPFRQSQENIEQDQSNQSTIIRYKRFNPTYTATYSIFVCAKIVLVALFYEQLYSTYILLTAETLYFAWFLKGRPYHRVRFFQISYCYSLHNIHNLWNSFGLIALIVIIIIANSTRPLKQTFIIAIKFTVLGILLISLIFAFIRLFMSKRLARMFKRAMEENKKADNTFDNPFEDIEDTQRVIKKVETSPKKLFPQEKNLYNVGNISNFQEQNVYNRPRRQTGRSSKSSSPTKVRRFL